MKKKIIQAITRPLNILGGLVKKLIKPVLAPAQRGKVRRSAIIVVLIVLTASAFSYPKYFNQGIDWVNKRHNWNIPQIASKDFYLGLDLQGGTHLVYEADVTNIASEDRDNAVEGVRDVIEQRVNFFGVTEPLVQTNKSGGKYKIIVELAGVKDVNEAINMIGQTPILEFKEEAKPVELTEEQKAESKKHNESQKKKGEEVLQKLKRGGDFKQFVASYSEDETSKNNGGDLGLVGSNSPFPIFYDKAKVSEKGIVPELITDSEGLNIISIGDKIPVAGNATEVKARHLLICWKDAVRCEKENTKEEAKAKIDELKKQATPENFEQLAKDNSTEPGADSSGGDLGWFQKGQMVPEFEQAVFGMAKGTVSDVVETAFGYHLILKEDEKPLYEYPIARILLKTQPETTIAPTEQWQTTGLSGKQLERAQVVFDPNTNQPQISVTFDEEGKDLFAKLTESNVNKQIAIFLDKRIISAPKVNEPIKTGTAVISGSFDIAEAKELAQRLNSGALPVPVKLLSQQTIGATLGQDSLSKSFKAGLVGFILVMIFMVLFYRLPGLVAVISLLSYVVLMMVIFKYSPLHLTLTLFGIAGFIFSMGIAVDANVLIFERLKEELKSGKPLTSAIEEGFNRAWLSIRDGNTSTLITCFIMFMFGTSTIKGFAITLSIGILVSLFSAIMITRVLLKLITPWFGKYKWLFLDKQ